ncbi:MAG: transcription elongation factor GreA [Deltaproteobacteria bacterium]|nr:transcription elongation factor GreA [Deltaproteobacteria bacterium]
MRAPIPMTPDGLAKLKEELKRLKTVDKIENIRDIEVARAHGDLSENAEYSAAKERQSHIAGRIAELEEIVACAQVIDPSGLDHEKVVFGATVRLSDTDSGEEVTYQIVGVHESDVKAGRISVESPLAKSLIGKTVDDLVKLKTARGEKEFEVLEIVYK